MSKRFSILAIAIAAIAFSAPSAFAQASGGTGTGGAGGGAGTTLSPVPAKGGEIDLPIGEPSPNVEQADPKPNPVEDPGTGPKFYDEDIPVKTDSIIYVIDVSGSMSWDDHTYTALDGSQQSGPRIDRAKVEMIKSIQALPKEFSFNVLSYDCDIYRWSASKQKADPGPKASAIQWTSNLEPMGATGTGPAVATALGDKDNLTVVLLSDGAPNCGANDFSGHLRMIQSANSQHATIHCFGISCYGSFEQFMRDVASTSGGRYFGVP